MNKQIIKHAKMLDGQVKSLLAMQLSQDIAKATSIDQLNKESVKLGKIADAHHNCRHKYLRRSKSIFQAIERIFWYIYYKVRAVTTFIEDFSERVCEIAATKHLDKFAEVIKDQREIQDYIREQK